MKLLWSALLNGVGHCVNIGRLLLTIIAPVERKNQETVSVLCLHEITGKSSMPRFDVSSNGDHSTHHIFWITIPLFQPTDTVEDYVELPPVISASACMLKPAVSP